MTINKTKILYPRYQAVKALRGIHHDHYKIHGIYKKQGRKASLYYITCVYCNESKWAYKRNIVRNQIHLPCSRKLYGFRDHIIAVNRQWGDRIYTEFLPL